MPAINSWKAFPADLLELMYNNRQRDVVRALHRNAHLDEVDAPSRITGDRCRGAASEYVIGRCR